MGAGLIQIAAIGPQDFHLTANPQITFFKSVFKRHTNFSKEVKRIYFSGETRPSFGSKDLKATIQNEGDLLGNVFLDISVTATSSNPGARTVANFSNSLVEKIECQIGGYTIDTQYGRFYQILDELEGNVSIDNQLYSDITSGGKYSNIDRINEEKQELELINENEKLKGNYTLCFGGTQNGNAVGAGTYTKRFYYPLKFWFNKNPGQFLPLVSLYKHQVDLLFSFAELNKVIGNSALLNNFNLSVKLYGEFYYLDQIEKKRFSQSNHEYVIEQLQLNNNNRIITTDAGDGNELSIVDYELYFSHPVKYISWALVNEGTPTNNSGQGPCYFTSLTTSSIYGNDGDNGSVELLLEGVTREIEMPMIYYTRFQPFSLFKNVPQLDRVGVYSFALNPLDFEPSGTCNFSKLYDKNLKISFSNNNIQHIKLKDLYIYAVNYNVLTITNGMAALRYA